MWLVKTNLKLKRNNFLTTVESLLSKIKADKEIFQQLVFLKIKWDRLSLKRPQSLENLLSFLKERVFREDLQTLLKP